MPVKRERSALEVRLDRFETGVPGLDVVLDGGIPKGSLVLIGGPPGAGKTILSTQIAFHRATQGRQILMLTALSEATAKLIAYLQGLDFFRPELVGSEIQILNIQKMLMDEGLDATLAEIRGTVVERGVDLLIIDSLRSLYAFSPDRVAVQNFIFGLGSALFIVGCTTILIEDQRLGDAITTPDQAISDAILMLNFEIVGRQCLRQVEIMKMRGANPLVGRHSFDISSAGVSVYPTIEALPIEEQPSSSARRLGWGVPKLDDLTGGGVPAMSSTLVTGTTGIGKTTLCLQFICDGISKGESCLYVVSDERPGDLLARASSIIPDLESALASGMLRVLYAPPGQPDPDRIIYTIMSEIDRRPVARLVIDSIGPIEQGTAREHRFSAVLASLTHYLAARGATTLVTRDTGQSVELEAGGEAYYAIPDNVVVMRPVPINRSQARTLLVLKMRSSGHQEGLCRFDIADEGIEIQDLVEPSENVIADLSGTAAQEQR